MGSRIAEQPVRQIHLDFHTPGFVPVGEEFDVVRLFDTLQESRINSVAFFAKCHHGYSYFDTKVATRHPGLNFDMFGQVAQEAKRRDMDLLAYFSLNVDEVAAERHPEWVARHRDGTPVDSQILEDGSELYWRWLCSNRSGYLEEYFFPHVRECLSQYEVNGIFIDMAGYLTGSCYCQRCLEDMQSRGLDPDNLLDHNRFNFDVMQGFARNLRRIMDEYLPGMRLELMSFNSFGEDKKAPGVVSEFYVESLAYQMGWLYFPIMGRYLGHTGLPVIGYTGRFLRNWGDFGTVVSPHQLKIQLAQHLSIGASSGIGDHIHCNGQLEEAVYEVIKEGMTFVEERQKYCQGLDKARETAILVPEGMETSGAVCDSSQAGPDMWDNLYGMAKLLIEGHYQWDVITAGMDLAGLSSLILLHPYISNEDIDRFEEFVQAGGTLLAGSNAVLVDESIAPRWHKLLGVSDAVLSPHKGVFYRMSDGEIASGIPDMAHYVHASSLELTAAAGAVELAKTFYAPCVRSREAFYGHFHGPDTQAGGPALLEVQRGAGRIIVMAQDTIGAYLDTGYHVHRRLVHNLLNAAMPKRMIKTDAPSLVEITAGYKDGATVLQFSPFIADRRHRHSFESLNEAVPIRGAQVELRCAADVSRVCNPLTNEDIAFRQVPGGIAFEVPEIIDHLVLLVR